MQSRDLIDEYESQSGKRAVVDGKETIGFKRWKQQQKSDPKLEEVILRFKNKFKKDIKDIIQIYLEKANIPSPKNTVKYLKNYRTKVFPSKVIYKDQSIEINSDGSLSLSNLSIKDLRNVKGLFKLYFLSRLSLYRNSLEIIPEEIGNLINLRKIAINHNNISTLPKEIENLTNLEYLNMNDNDLSEIPKEICNLPNLETLKMVKNNITKIPKEISNLKNLEILKMGDNNIYLKERTTYSIPLFFI